VTSVDVARRAGVSQSTVSLVMSGKAQGRVSSETEATVWRAVRELGYRPNIAARALRSGAAGAVGLIVPDVTHPFFGGVLRGAQTAAWSAGYAVVMVDIANDERWEIASFETLRAGPVDGFLFFAVDPPRGARGRSAQPAVVIDSDARGLPAVLHDGASGTRAVVEHLVGLGHRRFGHLASMVESWAFHVRRDELGRGLEEAGLDPGDVWRVHARLTQADGHRAGVDLLSRVPRPTAVFCDDDLLATGFYLAARELGLRIPADVSVVGFDDLGYTVALDPPLTTVRIDGADLGATAFATLAARMAGRRTRRRQVRPVELVERGSTAPPAS
jgi:LacI family transcriptional regulator, repressor for deo operon, udp, cdd, tsx, nupC, and nupG